MNTLKQLLYTTDFTDLSLAALPHAVSFARFYKAKLHFAHVSATTPKHKKPDPPFDTVVERARSLAGSYALEIETHQITGDVTANAIRELARKLSIDLILMSTHGRKGLQHFFLGSVTSEVLRGAECSVFVAKSMTTSSQPYRKILVPVDFSPYSLHQVKIANRFAQLAQSEMHLYHVVEPQAMPDFYSYGAIELDNYPAMKKNLFGQLRDLAENAGAADFYSHVGMGIPSNEVVNLVKKLEIDLVIASTNGHRGHYEIPLGGSVEAMARLLPCPIWALRSESFPS